MESEWIKDFLESMCWSSHGFTTKDFGRQITCLACAELFVPPINAQLWLVYEASSHMPKYRRYLNSWTFTTLNAPKNPVKHTATLHGLKEHNISVFTVNRFPYRSQIASNEQFLDPWKGSLAMSLVDCCALWKNQSKRECVSLSKMLHVGINKINGRQWPFFSSI